MFYSELLGLELGPFVGFDVKPLGRPRNRWEWLSRNTRL
jgi:hypothetical protein